MTFPDVCLVGLHARSDGGNQPADFQAAKVGKVEAVKLMTTHPPEDVDRFREAGVTFFIARIYEDLSNRVISPDDFVRWQEAPNSSMRRLYAKGIRHWEIHNEPNLVQEGLGKSWTDGYAFAAWFIRVVGGLRRAFPDIQIGFPGLSPGGTIPGVRQDAELFIEQARTAFSVCDWVAAHAYEVYNTTDVNAGGSWRIIRKYTNLPMAITEFSSPLQTPQTQAKQYRVYYEALRSEPNLFGAFSFVVSGQHFQHEAWRKEDGSLTVIPHEVALRSFATHPALPQSPLGTWVVNGNIIAYIRDWQGNIVRAAQPRERLDVYAFLSTAGGFDNRAVINRDYHHIWKERLSLPNFPPMEFIHPDTEWLWPVRGVQRPIYTALFNKQVDYGLHEGVDIKVIDSPNREIVSVFNGTVIHVHQWNGTKKDLNAYGRFVIVRQDDGYDVWYCHLDRVVALPNQKVSRGSLIGIAGNTGNSTGPHLHLHVLDPRKKIHGYVFNLPVVNPQPLLP